jgi:hypothetical protein
VCPLERTEKKGKQGGGLSHSLITTQAEDASKKRAVAQGADYDTFCEMARTQKRGRERQRACVLRMKRGGEEARQGGRAHHHHGLLPPRPLSHAHTPSHVNSITGPRRHLETCQPPRRPPA